MAAPGSNNSQPSTPNLPQKKPIPAPRNQVKFSANSVYQNNENLDGKKNTSIYNIPKQNEVEHYRNLLQQKIEQQSSQQSVAITTADILKLNVPFFSKYRVISLQKMLKDNEVCFLCSKICIVQIANVLFSKFIVTLSLTEKDTQGNASAISANPRLNTCFRFIRFLVTG